MMIKYMNDNFVSSKILNHFIRRVGNNDLVNAWWVFYILKLKNLEQMIWQIQKLEIPIFYNNFLFFIQLLLKRKEKTKKIGMSLQKYFVNLQSFV